MWAASKAPMPAIPNGSPAAQALLGSCWFVPHIEEDEVIKDQLIETFFSFSDRRGGFALIHVLPAHVCHRLRLHGITVDRLLTKLHGQTVVDANYAINLDRGGGEELPPSEDPFRIGKRAFYLITLLKR